MKNSINDFSSNELNIIADFIDEMDDIECLKKIIAFLESEKEKEEKMTLNDKFTINMLKKLESFSPYEEDLLYQYNITNLSDLINLDIDNLVVIPEAKKHFKWIISNYDMNSFEKRRKSNGKTK